MAKRQITRGSTSNILHVWLPDSSSTTGAGKTGLTNASSGLVISAIRPGESSVTTFTAAASNIETITTIGTYQAPSTSAKIRFKEVDSTNFPGLYEIHPRNELLDTTNTRQSLSMIITGATNLQPTPLEIELVGFTLQNTAPDVNIKQIDSDTTAPTNLKLAYNGTGYADGTAQAGGATSITLAAGASAVTDFYKWQVITILGGTGAGQSRIGLGYNGTTKVLTVHRAWATNPDNTSTYVINGAVDLYNLLVDGTFTQQQILSIMLSALAGTTATNGVFKDPTGASTRISGTVDTDGFRSSITLTPASV